MSVKTYLAGFVLEDSRFMQEDLQEKQLAGISLESTQDFS